MARDVRRGINKLYREAAEEFARRLRLELGDALHSVVLFGSVARKQATRDSDIDVLVIGDRPEMRDSVFHVGLGLMEQSANDILFSEVFFVPAELRQRVQRRSPLMENIAEEGLILYDDGTFASICRGLSAGVEKYSA